MSPNVSERSFEEAIECGLLQHGPDACVGDAPAIREISPPYGETPPGGYTPYTTMAEKLQAMVVLGDANSRTKDYYDLHQLPRALAFDGPTLVESIRRTFARRASPRSR